MPAATVQHVLDHTLISQQRTDERGVVTLVRPDFSIHVQADGIKPNGSPARVELDRLNREIRVWIDDRSGTSKPNRRIRNALSDETRMRKVTCGCGERDVDLFVGDENNAISQNGWKIEKGIPACPNCARGIGGVPG
jgi:hypothetical protein